MKAFCLSPQTRTQRGSLPIAEFFAAMLLLSLPVCGYAQSAISAAKTKPTPIAATAPTVVPTLVPYSGVAVAADGKPLTGASTVTFQIFAAEKGGEALWAESQVVDVDAAGHYQAQLGATLPSGLPVGVFATGEGRWLEVQIAGQAPQPRVLLMSVPYAIKAADAATLGGLPASSFALAGMGAVAGVDSVKPDGTSTVTTPGGSSGFVAVFNGTSSIDDSVLYESGTSIGVGTATPAATLDVNGAVDARGLLTLENVGAATATAGKNSQPLAFVASAYNSSTKAATAQEFELKAEPASNDTTGPSGTLNLLFGSGTTAPAETGLSISSKGHITFAPGQTFPGGGGSGTITGVTTTSPLTGSGTSGSVALGLNVSALETTLNSKYAQLSGAAFTGTVQVNPASSSNGVIGTSGSAVGVLGESKTGSGVVGQNTSTSKGQAGVFGNNGTLSSEYSSLKGTYSASVWGDATASSAGMIGTSDGGYGGYFENHSTGDAALYARNDNIATAGQFYTNGGDGIYVETTSPPDDGYGYAIEAHDVAGGTTIYSQLGSPSGTGRVFDTTPTAIWADTGDASSYSAEALTATADDNFAAVMNNNSTGRPALLAENDTAGSTSALVFNTYGGNYGGSCTIDVSGNLSCSGKVSAVTKVANGVRSVETYSMQTAENWAEDLGSAELHNGLAHIDIEPEFAQTVNTGVKYHVFLTPNGDCKGLYVTAKSSGGFDVRELGGGTSSIEFDYRIVAKRVGSENERLTDVTDQMRALQEQHAAMHDPARIRKRPAGSGLRSGRGLRPGGLAQPVVQQPTKQVTTKGE